MKLFLRCGPCSNKFELAYTNSTKKSLAEHIGRSFTITCPHCRINLQGFVDHVWAENSYENMPFGTTAGASAVGFFFGPLGLGIGFLAGLAAGKKIKNDDQIKVDRFNYS